MRILVINGPNLNMLGKRDAKHYGFLTLDQINNQLSLLAKSLGAILSFFQSNYEGAIIDFLQKDSSKTADGILINPGALTHYGYSLRDALVDTNLPIVQVHLSNINNRETFRKIDVLDGVAIKKLYGKKDKSYEEGFITLINFIKNKT